MNEAFEVKRVMDIVDSHFDEYKQFLIDICNIESNSLDKQGVDHVGNFIEGFCLKKGFQARKHYFERAGNGLTITMNDNSSLPGIILMAHMDTVHEKGKFGYPPVKEDRGYLYGPGVVDCKGGIAVALLVMQALMETGYKKRPVKLILTSDEEVSNSLTGREGIDSICNEALGAAAAFNCEMSRPGKITVARKGIARFKVSIKGKAAHSGSAYFDGISAIKEAAHKIIEIEKESCNEKTTFNCGVIKGGEVENIIPEYCSFNMDIRFVTKDDYYSAIEHIKAIVDKSYIKGSNATLTELSMRPPMERTAGNTALFQHIQKVCEKYKFESVNEFFNGGGSDSAYTVQAGVPSVCSVGLEGDGGHTILERAKLSSLPMRAKMLVASVLEMPDNFNG